MSRIEGFFGFSEPDPAGRHLLTAMDAAQRTKHSNEHPALKDMETKAKKLVIPMAGAQSAGIAPAAVRLLGGKTFAAAMDGEFYNRGELLNLLRGLGAQPPHEEDSDAALALALYLAMGTEFVRRVSGVFALAIADEARERLILMRDRIGAKPLFYARRGETLYFASLPPALLACPGVKADIGTDGLNEIFGIGPARTPGNGIFRGISELKPAELMVCSPDGCRTERYWSPKSHPHEDSYEKTVETIRELVTGAISRQMESDKSGAPVCALLSGGLDSSLVSSVCAGILKNDGKQLLTFSFDFTDNDKYFKANDFQPSLDRPYVDAMVRFLGSDHHYLECGSQTQEELLTDSVLAAGLPVMADVDSSLLYFCSQVAKYSPVALTGECADEIFCGYPWYHKQEFSQADTFPWSRDLDARKVLLKDEILRLLSMDDYAAARFAEAKAETPACAEDSAAMASHRQMAWLNLRWFMQTLLNRMDRTSSAAGLTARVPFADHKIIEYVWNIPWEMKAKDGAVKHLLRRCGEGLLPPEILHRKKSPYPKTYAPGYEKLLAGRVRQLLSDASAPINQLLDREKTLRFIGNPSDYGRPWYGQLMAAPQMMAYVIQVNFWLQHYGVKISL